MIFFKVNLFPPTLLTVLFKLPDHPTLFSKPSHQFNHQVCNHIHSKTLHPKTTVQTAQHLRCVPNSVDPLLSPSPSRIVQILTSNLQSIHSSHKSQQLLVTPRISLFHRIWPAPAITEPISDSSPDSALSLSDHAPPDHHRRCGGLRKKKIRFGVVFVVGRGGEERMGTNREERPEWGRKQRGAATKREKKIKEGDGLIG